MFCFNLLFALAGFAIINCQALPGTLKEFKMIMSNPTALKELKKNFLSNGVPAEIFENKDSFDTIMAFSFLNYACNIDKFMSGGMPAHELVDSRTDCCNRLFVLDCVIDKSDDPKRDAILVDSIHCNAYLLEPKDCDLHISNFKRMQLKSVACYNDVIKTFGQQLQPCCIQNFQSQCFEYNFAADCKKFVEQGAEKCGKMAEVQTDCRNIEGCPAYKAKNLNQSFFTSNIFIGSLIAFAILFVGFFFICQRCNQPDTSLEIANETDSTKKKKLKNREDRKNKKKHKH